jgi:curved DNA-binding protein CbpA
VSAFVVSAFWSGTWVFVGAQQQRQHHHTEIPCTPTNVQYEWERWNYYELLGLTRPATTTSSSSDPTVVTLDSKSIRKAYRKQAQLWHPDKKHQQPHNSTTNSAAPSTTSSREESTARFAQIAQAYEVLNDEWKRREYDLYLQYCDRIMVMAAEEKDLDLGQKQQQHPRRWSKLFSKIDPFSVFEDFFFGKDRTVDDQEEDNDESSWFFDMPPQNSDPIRITKYQEEFKQGRDDIVRVSQTEEYAPDASSGRYYYRIVSQEFLKQMDPYTGNVVLTPLTVPYLREEGHQQERQQQHTAKASSKKLPRQSLLFPGDILTSSSALLVSPNRRYYAGLSQECELVIMADNAFGEDTPVWSSESAFASPDYCFATIRGPHLVIALGRPEMPHQILWYSEASQSDSYHTDYEDEASHPFSSPSTYLAQLENDGSLVVYKVWSPSPYFQELPLSSRAWLTARHFIDGTTRDDQYYESLMWKGSSSASHQSPFSSSSTSIATYKRCMYATGPLGCHRLARRLYQLSLEIFFRLKSIMGKMDAMFDTWMDVMMEEEYNKNYLQALLESTSGFGSHLVSKSARLVRRVLELIILRGASPASGGDP